MLDSHAMRKPTVPDPRAAWPVSTSMAIRRRLPLLASLLTVLWAPATALAAPPLDSEQAAQAALEVRSGRVLSVQAAEQDDTPVYRVKILAAGGEVHIILVNRETGEVITSP